MHLPANHFRSSEPHSVPKYILHEGVGVKGIGMLHLDGRRVYERDLVGSFNME